MANVTRPARGSILGGVAVTAFVAVVLVAVTGPYGMLILLAALAIPCGFLILRRPWLGMAVLAIQLPLDALGSRLLQGGSIALAWGAIKDLVLLLLLVAALRSTRRVPLGIVLAIAAVTVLAFPAGIRSGLTLQALYGFRNDVEPLLLVAVIPALLDGRSVRRLTSIIAWMAQASAAIAIYTWTKGIAWLFTVHIFPYPPGEFPFQFFSGGSRPRAFGTYASANTLGVAMDISLATILCREDWPLRKRLLLSILPAIAVVLSRSRSGMLGAALLALVIAARWLAPKIRGSATIVAIVSAAGAALAGFYLSITKISDPSALGHSASVASALHEIVASPFGYGLGQVGPRASVYSQTPILVESFVLLLALEVGVIALALYLYVLGRAAALSLRAARGNMTPTGGLAYISFAAVVASGVSQAVLPTMQAGSVSYFLWLVIGIGLWQADQLRREIEPIPASHQHPVNTGGAIGRQAPRARRAVVGSTMP